MKTIDIRINAKLIRKYEPCIEGLANFNRHYKDISIKTLINSKKISYEHKIWLLKRIVNIDLLILWSIDSSFAAYKYSVIKFDYYAADAADAASDYSNAAYHAITAANAAEYAITAYYAAYYAAYAAEYAANAADFYDKDNAKNERLQALLYFIETEKEH